MVLKSSKLGGIGDLIYSLNPQEFNEPPDYSEYLEHDFDAIDQDIEKPDRTLLYVAITVTAAILLAAKT